MSQGNYAPANRLLLARSLLVGQGCWACTQEARGWLAAQRVDPCTAAYMRLRQNTAVVAAALFLQFAIGSFGFVPFALLLGDAQQGHTFLVA